MNVVLSDNIKANPSWLPLIQDATKFLEENAGPSGASATVEWDTAYSPEANRMGQVINLKVVDGADTVTTIFDPQFLAVPHRIRLYVLQLWGRLLASRSQRMTQELLQSGQTSKPGAGK